MYNWTFNNTHKQSVFVFPYWLENENDEVEWLEEEYEDYEDKELPSAHDNENKENIDISDADF